VLIRNEITRDDAPIRSDGEIFLHPHSLCESETVGSGTRIWAFAHVCHGAIIGNSCNICDHVYIEGGVTIGDRVTVKNRVLLFEGVTIEDDVFLGPGVIFTNDMRPRAEIKRSGSELSTTRVCRGATLGAGVVVVCGVTVQRYAFVGAGTVVTRDVPAHAFVVGNPGRQKGWVCACGSRLDDRYVCSCGTAHRPAPDGGLERVSDPS
jgi:UDP-2-acetamido-3-amino-2,3-dideoxy-glucuronate N-acetyltransferase